MNKLNDMEQMTMQELGDVYYSEKGQNRLTRLPEKFYERAAAYLKRLQVKVECTRSEEASIYGGETYHSSEEIHRAREIVERIYNTRERKIVLAAMNSARGIKQDLKNLDHEEENLYYDSKLVFGENRDSILRFDRLNPRPERMHPETGINTTTDDFVDPMDIKEDRLEKVVSDIADKIGSGKEERGTEGEKVEDRTTSRHHSEMAEGSVVVRALQDIEDFTALDGSIISLNREDIIHLDGKMAKLLIEGNFVELVEG